VETKDEARQDQAIICMQEAAEIAGWIGTGRAGNRLAEPAENIDGV
jgi:hypothetical protein